VKLDDLARQYNVSRERIRQIEMRALTKLQKTMKARMPVPAMRSQCGVPALMSS